MACELVFGENRGGRRGAAPGVPFRTDPGMKGWRRDKTRICREMHEPDASVVASTGRRLRSDSRVPFPAESEPASARESEKCFPKKNTHRPGVCGQSRIKNLQSEIPWAGVSNGRPRGGASVLSLEAELSPAGREVAGQFVAVDLVK